jgi:hypothetical protein
MSYVSHITSFVVKVATIYSACVEERAIVPHLNGSSHKPQRGHILKKACQLEEDMVNAAAQNKENKAISEDAVTEGFPSELGRHSIEKA